MAIKPIEILINAKDQASSVFDGLSAKIGAVGVAIAGYFGVKAFTGVVKGAADLEQGMSRVQAATGASAEEMAKLRQAAEDAGANTKFTSTEAAGALENLAKAGLSATDSIAALPAVLNLAQAGDIGLGEASEFVTKAVMGMGLAFTDSARVADVLAQGANATNTSVTGLAQALSYAAPVASSLGLSLESTVAIIGKFADAGIDASRAGTALNSILSQFANPASKFREELGAAGITTNNFETALHQLAASGPRGAKAINAVGQEAGPALRALLNQGMGSLDDLKAKLDGAAGSAAATAKVMQDNLNGSLDGLSSAWDTVKNTLGTPVLPVLQAGVEKLSASFTSLVKDGTITRFGEAIATAFSSGIKWAQDFIAQVDLKQVAADLRAFADRSGEVFKEFGEHATAAGQIAKTAYGVMSAGVNGVLVAVYSIGSGFASVAANMQTTISGILSGLAKITFGDVSRSFKEAAEDMRISAEATYAARDALVNKSAEAFNDMAEGARLARDGFAGIAAAAAQAETSTTKASAAIAVMSKELIAGAGAAAAYGAAQQRRATADQVAATAAEEHAVKIKALEAEYAALKASGNINEAIIVFDKLTKAQRESAGSTKAAATDIKALEAEYAALKASGNINEAIIVFDKLTKAQRESAGSTKAAATDIKALEAEYAALKASGNINEAIIVFDKLTKAQRESAGASKDVAKASEEAALKVEEAFRQLGITSSAKLKEAAVDAAANFETIKNSGTASALDIQNAFAVMADRLLAASGPAGSVGRAMEESALQAKAAAAGLTIEFDKSGKAIVKAMTDGSAAVDNTTKSVGRTTEQLKAQVDAWDTLMMKYKLSADYNENQIALLEKQNALIEKQTALENKRLGRDSEGYALDTGGKRVSADVITERSVYEQAKSAGLTDAQALKITNRFVVNGEVKTPDRANAEKGETSYTLIAKAINELVMSNAKNAAAIAAQKEKTAASGATEADAQKRLSGAEERPKTDQPKPSSTPPSANSPAPTSAATTVNITLDGNNYAIKTDADGSETLQLLLRQLAQAKTTSR